MNPPAMFHATHRWLHTMLFETDTAAFDVDTFESTLLLFRSYPEHGGVVPMEARRWQGRPPRTDA